MWTAPEIWGLNKNTELELTNHEEIRGDISNSENPRDGNRHSSYNFINS